MEISVRAAAGVVDDLIGDFIRSTEPERLRIFRAYLQATVLQASPIALGMAACRQIDLPTAFARLKPKPDWPWRPAAFVTPSAWMFRPGWRRGSGRTAPPSASDDRWVVRRAEAMGGFVENTGDGLIGFDFAAGCLSVCGRLGGCFIRTVGATCRLTLDTEMPETVMATLPGTALGRLVHHSALSLGDYRIGRVEPASDGLGPTIVFRAEPVPFALPWPTPPAHPHEGTSRHDG